MKCLPGCFADKLHNCNIPDYDLTQLSQTLHPETLCSGADGKPFVDVLRGQGIKVGIKVDTGLNVRLFFFLFSVCATPHANARLCDDSQFLLVVDKVVCKFLGSVVEFAERKKPFGHYHSFVPLACIVSAIMT